MSRSRPRILIVDDDPSNIHVLNKTLRDEYDTFFASCGDDALSVALKQVPDLILLDVMMPGMDGYTVCRRLREELLTREIPVMFVTALSEDASELEGLKLGAVDYLTKPINPPVVRARIYNQLNLKRREDILKHLCFVDGLTGIANRRRFDEAIDHEWRRCGRRGEALSLLMIDVDWFKAYNDHYGHPEGDICLRRVATTLNAEIVRAGDLLTRYGGEEFACLLPETDQAGALHMGRTLCQAIRAMAYPHTESAFGIVTISVGAATLYPVGNEGYAELVAAADQCLYQAKHSGRNQVCGA